MKTIKKIMILLNIAFLLLMDLPRASAITETSGNSLSFSLSIDESCKELIQLAECYSLKGVNIVFTTQKIRLLAYLKLMMMVLEDC